MDESWQPLETAPREYGKQILVRLKKDGEWPTVYVVGYARNDKPPWDFVCAWDFSPLKNPEVWLPIPGSIGLPGATATERKRIEESAEAKQLPVVREFLKRQPNG